MMVAVFHIKEILHKSMDAWKMKRKLAHSSLLMHTIYTQVRLENGIFRNVLVTVFS